MDAEDGIRKVVTPNLQKLSHAPPPRPPPTGYKGLGGYKLVIQLLLNDLNRLLFEPTSNH